MIWVTQMICPNRHSLIVTGWDDTQATEEKAIAFVKQLAIECGCAGPQLCSRCGATQALYESASASLPTIEAMDMMLESLADKHRQKGLDYIAELRRLGLSPT